MSTLVYSVVVWLGWSCPPPVPVPVYRVSPIEVPRNVRPWKPPTAAPIPPAAPERR